MPAGAASPPEPSLSGQLQPRAQGCGTRWVLEQHHTCPRLSVGTGAVVPPPGSDSKTRALPEVKE